ncbi:MAG TPA: reverse transcriptase domain-containing protein [Acidimicrobiales bacterium]|nr:reverse transcriptase domain-containing protein [Acidimicrobiales bacterium]
MPMADPWRRVSCVPPGAATAASKRPPSRSLLAEIATDAPWEATVDAFRSRNPRRTDRIADYERLLAGGDHLRVGDAVLAGRYQPAPPDEVWLNKVDGRKKRVFSYGPTDELLFRVVHRLIQPLASEAASPWCRSFLPGGGARAAFRCVLSDPDAGSKSALRLDVRDYFNSIDVEDLLRGLPGAFTEGALGALLQTSLRDRRVRRRGAVVDGGPKGVMAGTPVAPLLATLYLRDVDDEVAATGATYARYSDDIVALAPPGELASVERLVRRRLAERALVVNEEKSSVARPGEPWDFLGFRYAHGSIALAPVTERKLKARTTRLARSLLRWRERTGASGERATGAFVRRTNLRLYGVPAGRAEFSWATWFLPMLGSPAGLDALDAHVRREARYAATGRRTARTIRDVPYTALAGAGHLPLVAAYWAMRDGVVAYDALVRRRTGLA